jgi:hypothetical protein
MSVEGRRVENAFRVSGDVSPVSRHRLWLRFGSTCRLGLRTLSNPDQDAVLFVHGEMQRVNQLLYQVAEVIIIEVKPAFQGSV